MQNTAMEEDYLKIQWIRTGRVDIFKELSQGQIDYDSYTA